MIPVAKVIDNKIQYFPVAGLIFTSDIENNNLPTSKDLFEMQMRFKSLTESFNQENKNYHSSFVKNNSALPYNSKSILAQLDEHLIINFRYSYNNPLFIIYDVEKDLVQNYIDIENAKIILNDKVFEYIQEMLHMPRNLDRIYKGITNFNEFVDEYKEILEKYKNENTISGYECIEIDL